ncbi:MAG TPA: stage II sporulation protein M [Anaerolineales bacterium]|nr:stage II sporulation protein M [Anaerolineales bacterium]
MAMHDEEFYQSRRRDWEALGVLLERSQSALRRLSPDDLARLGSLYRAATSDLAIARRDFPSHAITRHLNQLVARAHSVIYRGEPLARRRALRFVAWTFPRLYRQALPFVLIAALFFAIPALASSIAIQLRPETSRWLLPQDVQRLIPKLEDKELWTAIPMHERPYASSFIMQNNIQVAFLAFGAGILGGFPTLWIMIQNGLILGGLTRLTANYGLGFELWSFVIAHGVLELSVVFIAGGCGLMLGWAVLHPGMQRRREALAAAARKAIYLLLGCVPLLVLAGVIEGFLSPAEGIPSPVKWVTGIGIGVLLQAYLLLAGRPKSSKRRPSTAGNAP